MKPIMPIHFTRGYVWASLFLLGLPALHDLFQNPGWKKRSIVLGLFSAMLLSDNFLWIINNVRSTATTPSVSYITAEQKKLVQLISKNSNNKTLLIGNDEVLVYMSTAHSKAYPWYSHPFTTPFVAKKTKALTDFMQKGTLDPAWKNREVIFVFHKKDSAEWQRSQSLPFFSETLGSTESYLLQKAVIPN